MAYDGLGGASAAAAAASSRSCAEPLAEWPRNSRVAANSPSLCPTMFSVMYTGMNLFPLCTARVWPTKSGVMVERRDQVLNTFFSFFSFRAVIFTRSEGSTYGPFLTLRPIVSTFRIADLDVRVSNPQSAIANPQLLRRFAPFAPPNDELRGRLLLVPCLLPLDLAPGICGGPAARGFPLAATQRVVDGVHRHAAHPRIP